MLMPMPTDDQVTAGGREGLEGSSPQAGEREGLAGSSPRASTDPADQAGPAAALGRDYGATLWAPSERSVREARITGYAAWLRDGRGPDLSGYDEIWRWSVAEPAAFWSSIWDFFDVLGRRGDGPVLSGGPMPAVAWFPGAR